MKKIAALLTLSAILLTGCRGAVVRYETTTTTTEDTGLSYAEANIRAHSACAGQYDYSSCVEVMRSLYLAAS